MTLPGLDVSTYQATTPPLAGFAFMFARATYNLSPDARYDQHMAAAKAAGIVRGAYHFGTGASTPQAQASAFLASAHDAQILALDLEGDPHPMTQPQAALFISTVRATDPLHRKIGLYHSLSGFPSGIGQDFNWVAAWQATAPVVPWAFWQFTSSGSVPGYAGHLDLDQFNGTQAQLNAMAGIVPPVGPHVRVASNPFQTYTVRSGIVIGNTARREPVGTIIPVDPHTTAKHGVRVLYLVTGGTYKNLYVWPHGALPYSA